MRQVYAASLKAGYSIHPKTGEPAVLEHAAFGSVLGEDGKPFKTRSGESVKLADLIEETVTRATAALESREMGRAQDRARRIAEAVGVAALKYGDLSSNRALDYTFSSAPTGPCTPSTRARTCTCARCTRPASRPATRSTRRPASRPCSSTPRSGACSARTASRSRHAAARA